MCQTNSIPVLASRHAIMEAGARATSPRPRLCRRSCKGGAMATKILGLAGSPRRRGNTERLLDSALEGAGDKRAEVEKVVLATQRVELCNSCFQCTRTGQCILHDDVESLYPRLQAADAVILASPVYFRGVTAQAKAVIDRCLPLWALRYNLKQPWRQRGDRARGLFISAAAGDGPIEFRGALLEARGFFQALDVRWQPPLLFNGVNSRSDLLGKHPSALEQAREAGARLAV